MKRMFALALILGLSSAANAQEVNLSTVALSIATQDVHTMNLINWKVGETADYSISVMQGMLTGTSHKFADKEDNNGSAIWIEEDVSLMGQQQTVRMLINRADGKTLKLVQNGQDAAIPTDAPVISSQDYASITVAAGTFKCIHVKGTEQGKAFEIWANPVDTVMDGAVKTVMDTGMMGNMEMDLTAFHKVQ